MQVPVGCAVGQVGHVVQVHTGVAPAPQTQTTLPKVQVPSPVMQALWLFGAAEGQLGFVGPPLLLPLPPPLLLPLLLPLPLLPLPPPLLLPLLLPLPLLPLGESPVLASPPTLEAVLPPQPGAAKTRPPTDTDTRTRTWIALIERPPQFRPVHSIYLVWRGRCRLGSVTR
jgi:hypothetical protein